MIEAPYPLNEPLRLDALRRLHLLDTPIEDRFERITRMVCRVFDVPISCFTLIDDDRQWLKSVQGLVNVEAPRGISFCAHAITYSQTFVVPDARLDDRFFDNPLVTGAPHIRFYAGHPVLAPDGHSIGTLCAIDTKPREFDQKKIQLLADMAQMIEAELRLMEVSAAQRQLIFMLDPSDRFNFGYGIVEPRTRLWNSEAAMEILKQEWVQAEAQDVGIGILLIDVDEFKTTRNSFGALATNAVLREIGGRLLTALRPRDLCAYTNAGRFLIALPQCLAARLPEIARHILQAVRAELVKVDDGRWISATISIGGVIGLPAQGDGMLESLAEAEASLQRANQHGGNQYDIGLLTDYHVVKEMPFLMRISA